MSFVEHSYVLTFQTFEGEEKNGEPEQLAFFFIVRLLTSHKARKIILDRDKKNRTTLFYITRDSERNINFKVSPSKRKENIQKENIIVCFYFDNRKYIASINRSYFEIDFKKFVKLDPITTLSRNHDGIYCPNVDIYKTNNNKYKFRYTCSNEYCRNRETLESKFSRCSNCLRVQYCSRECQKKDWKMHKIECEIIDEDFTITIEN